MKPVDQYITEYHWDDCLPSHDDELGLDYDTVIGYILPYASKESRINAARSREYREAAEAESTVQTAIPQR